MRILITGGAGCLGSNLVEHWVPLGHEILVLDNFATGKREVVPHVTRLEVREGDIADSDFVESSFGYFMPEIVVHAAAAYKDPEDWVEDARSNILGSVHVSRASKRYGARKLINFQTALCYGQPSTIPISETHPTAPFTSYGISKTAGEQYILQSGIPSLSLRIANVTGPRLAIGPIPTFYKRLKAGQQCFCSDTVRDFLDISDFIAFMDIAIEADSKSGVFNVASGEGHSIHEVFEVVCQYLGIQAPSVPLVAPAPDDVARVVLDTSSTAAAFGWRAKVAFTETIRKQLQWYDTYGVNDVHSHLRPAKNVNL